MARPVRGLPTPWPPEGAGELETQPDAGEVKVLVDYNPEVDYEGSESKNEPVAQKKRGKLQCRICLFQAGTICQRMMPCGILQRIQQIH